MNDGSLSTVPNIAPSTELHRLWWQFNYKLQRNTMKTLRRKLGKVLETLPVEAIPSDWLYDEYGNLKQEGAALSVGLYCCHLANIQKKNGEFELNKHAAEDATGYMNIRRTLIELSAEGEAKLITQVKRGISTPSIYSIVTCSGYEVKTFGAGDKPRTLRTILFDEGLGYDDVPKYIMENLLAFKGEPLAAALSGLRQAQDYNSTVFTAVLKEWKDKSGISKDKAMCDAWGVEEFKNLLNVKHVPKHRTAVVRIYDPIKHTALKNVKHEAVERAKDRVAISQYEEENAVKFLPAELKAWFVHEFPQAELRGDEYYTECHECHKFNMHSNFSDPDYAVGKVACNSGSRKKVCTFSGKGKVPYHLVAIRDGISGAEAEQRMETYILGMRGGQ